jgi:hypothetical protein
MSKSFAPFAVCAAALLSACRGVVDAKPQAEAAIVRFHQLYNDGKSEQIWSEAGDKFRQASPKDKYDLFMGALQRKLGKVKSSENAGWRVGTFNMKTSVMMSQKTTFEQGDGTESFAFEIAEGSVTLVGYNVQSMELVTK